MTATASFSHRLRPILTAACLAVAGALVSAPASARGPEGVADVAEKVIDAVVNISTSQTVEAKGGSSERQAAPQACFPCRLRRAALMVSRTSPSG